MSLLAPPALAVPHAARDRWHRVDTEHFTVLANTRPKRAEWLALELERFRFALETLAGDGRDRRTRVFVFRSERSFTPYLPRVDGEPRSVAGYFRPGPQESFVALNGSEARTAVHTVYHEALHQFVEDRFPPIPAWVNEGLADFYSTFRTEPGIAEIGHPIPGHLWALRRGGTLPMDALFRVRSTLDGRGGRHANRRFYAQSWALVHHLLTRRPGGREQLTAYLMLLERGASHRQACRAAFGLQPEQLRALVHRHVRRRALGSVRLPMPALPEAEHPRARDVAPADALVALGELLVRATPEHAGEARAHFEAALALDAGHAGARAGLAGIERAAGRGSPRALPSDRPTVLRREATPRP